jgi:TetR/AcrR family transcriptional regulator, transcriptional repressor for nem operon
MPRHPDSKERLLRTAAELILIRGYSATTVDAICEACEIKKGSFYHHFESKEQLAIAALDADWNGFKEVLNDSFSPTRSPPDRFSTFVAANLRCQRLWYDRHKVVCGCPLFSLGAEIGTHEPKLRDKVAEHLNVIARYFETTIREGHALGVFRAPDAKASAWMLLHYIEGTLTMSRIRNDLQPLDALEAGIQRLLGVQAAAAA